jgi:transposase, IS5 family
VGLAPTGKRRIRRKIDGNPALQERCGPLLDLALRVRHQQAQPNS